ncbi:MAG: AAA family ATPase [Clostridia bacterium]|nr:AAA family ATPase [Clostridia bacterium]
MHEKIEIALLGRKLGHSLSGEIHKYLGSYDYRLYPLEPEELDGFFVRNDFRGLNVTIPYKLDVVKYCSELSETAKRIGCVNTVVRREDGSFFGDNTDYYGFSYMAKKAGISFEGKKVLILGNGGASLTARLVAADMGAESVVIVARKLEDNFTNIQKHSDAQIIVNCTPVGMYPNNGERLVDLGVFSELEGVLDMIYNPARTPMLLDAADRGVKYANGLTMLVAQAAKSAEYFRQDGDSYADIDEIVDKISLAQKNIVFVGMPGCGKSTLAVALASKLGKEYIDTDDMIVDKTGKTIPEIFADEGETYFRDVESECIKEAAKQSGKVIATGGGAILRPENRDAIRGNSFVVFLKRDIPELSKKGRPLSKDISALKEMYKLRLPLYELTADAEIDICEKQEDTLNNLLELLESMQ